MNCAPSLRTTSVIAVFILICIHTVSHSQYYSQNVDYFDDDGVLGSPSPMSPFRRRGRREHFNSRNIQPPYRELHYHHHYLTEPPDTTINYFGTLSKKESADTGKSDSEIFIQSQEESSHPMSQYRRRYKTPLFQVPPDETFKQFSPPEHGIGITIVNENDNQMNIVIQNRNKPIYHDTPRHPPLITDAGEGNIERPPSETVVVVFHNTNRPSICEAANMRISRTDGQCYEGGSACGPLMQVYSEPGQSIYGDCDCKINNGLVSRPLVYWRPHDKCYLLFQQGPCHYNHWLILDGNDFPLCAPRSCPLDPEENERSNKFWFLYRGECYKTGEYSTPICSVTQPDHKVYFPLGSNQPACLDREPIPMESRAILSPIRDLPCKPGHKKVQTGECKRIARFENDYNYDN